jgi:hypothetical protein
MTLVLKGIVAGILAGMVMGLVSDAAYRSGIFKSSLILVDGSFVFRFSRERPSKRNLYLAGVPVHLVTGGVFGGMYMLIIYFVLSLAPSALTVALYFLLLWLSMLFVALPVAGEGVLGRRSGPLTWLEQLFLHLVFGVGYYLILGVL